MKDSDGHELLDGKPVHESDRTYSAPVRIGAFWCRQTHCLRCGCVISKPVTQREIETRAVTLPENQKRIWIYREAYKQ